MPEAQLAASGPIAQPFLKMAALLSQCPTFQSLMGVGTTEAALALIVTPFWDVDDYETETVPIPGATITRVDGDTCHVRNHGFSVGDLTLEIRTKPDTNFTRRSNQLISFMNSVGATLQDMMDLQQEANPLGGTHIQIHEPIEEIVTPQLTTQDEEADEDGKPFMVATYVVHYEE